MKIVTGTPDEMMRADHHRFLVNKPDPDFSPAKNKAIIEKTIKDYEAKREKEMKDRINEYEERADAVVSYLKHLDHDGTGSKDLGNYFGKRNLAYLRGLEIREKLMGGLTVKDKNGLIVKPGRNV